MLYVTWCRYYQYANVLLFSQQFELSAAYFALAAAKELFVSADGFAAPQAAFFVEQTKRAVCGIMMGRARAEVPQLRTHTRTDDRPALHRGKGGAQISGTRATGPRVDVH